MTRTGWALSPAILFLAACSGGETTTTDTSAASCGVEIRETYPAADATDAYYRSGVEFHLSKPDPEMTPVVTLADANGNPVEGTTTLSTDGTIVRFELADGVTLQPQTTYTATIEYCTGTASISFTTSDLGLPLDDENALVGKAYSLDLQSGRITVPEGIGSVLEPYLEFVILVGVDDVSNGEIHMTGAVADEKEPDHQDYCEPTIAFPAADFSQAPYFQLGPQTTAFSVAGYDITIEDLLISATFSPDGSWFGGGVLSGSIDTRPLVPLLFDKGESEDAICSLVTSVTAGLVECEACPTDGEAFCLSIEAHDLKAYEVDTTVEFIEQEDCHEQCPVVGKTCKQP